MKNRIFILAISLLLTSCELPNNKKTESKNNTNNSSNIIDNVSKNSSLSTSKSESVKPSDSVEIPDNLYDTFFTINDVHGSLEENVNVSSPEAGLAKLDYFIKNDFNYNDGSFLVANGDLYQGSYQAYHNMSLVSDALSKMGVIASSVGNHEFDWSVSKFKEISDDSPFPFLACNILKDNKQVDFVDYSYKYTTLTGATFGFVGLIGPGEESSILTSYIQGYTFSSDASYVEAELDKLSDCDYKIILTHDATSNGSNISSLVNTLLDDNYSIDAIVGAHTHYFEKDTIKGIPYIQAGSNSKGYGYFRFKRKDKSCVDYGYVSLSKSKIQSVSDSDTDQELYNLIHDDEYYVKSSESMNKTLNGTLHKDNELHKFLPTVMIDEVIRNNKKKTNKLIAVHNIGGIRSDIPAGNLTRGDLFKAEPFMNKVRIQRNISGKNIQNAFGIGYSNNLTNTTNTQVYMVENDEEFNASTTYDLITIDYVYEKSYCKRFSGTWEKIGANGEEVLMPDTIVNYVDNYNGTIINASDFNCQKS